MLPHVGTDSRVWREVKQLGVELGGLDALLASQVQSDVAILFDWENWWALEQEGKPSNDIKLLPQITTLYAELFRRNITVDFAHPEADLTRYRLVIAPHLYLVGDRAAQNIERYVAQGGTLLMTFFSGIVDGSDHIRLGGYPTPFRDLLGLWIEEFAPYANAQTNVIETVDGRQFACKLWSDIIHLTGAEMLAHYQSDYFAGGPAVTRHRFGKGVSYYLGTALAQAGLAWFFDHVCEQAKMQNAHPVPRGVEVTRRSDGAHTWLFVLNHSDEEVQIDLPAQSVDLLADAAVQTSLRLAPKGVAIVQLAAT